MTYNRCIRHCLQEATIPAEPTLSESQQQQQIVLQTLEDNKAEDIVCVDLRGKSDIADFMVIASGRSQRHVGALAGHIEQDLAKHGFHEVSIQGKEQCDWVLVDSFHIIIHLFRPEVRSFYNLEKMWDVPAPQKKEALASA